MRSAESGEIAGNVFAFEVSGNGCAAGKRVGHSCIGILALPEVKCASTNALYVIIDGVAYGKAGKTNLIPIHSVDGVVVINPFV